MDFLMFLTDHQPPCPKNAAGEPDGGSADSGQGVSEDEPPVIESCKVPYILPPPPVLSACNSRWQRPLFAGDEYGQANNQFEDFPLKPPSCHARQSATLPSASKFSPILSNLGRPKNYSPTFERSGKASIPITPSNQYVYGK
ncbi:hypothetical protein EG68_01453 [Paragonimus skrjabini miyazakii]|uniref:Uncharacterized protein n=1 Tax=Paragonimus skrjabini miyazakii TaxID=59628 RepID=A0A8S9Z2R3_9TREM|nr:hypothetical protein EG68_01453 [Paragonimus skrjabini miyazakii]